MARNPESPSDPPKWEKAPEVKEDVNQTADKLESKFNDVEKGLKEIKWLKDSKLEDSEKMDGFIRLSKGLIPKTQYMFSDLNTALVNFWDNPRINPGLTRKSKALFKEDFKEVKSLYESISKGLFSQSDELWDIARKRGITEDQRKEVKAIMKNLEWMKNEYTFLA
jgi:archaellum component FlaC